MFALRQKIFLLGLMLSFSAVPITAAAQTGDQAVARVILFYNPTCPHCREVMEHVLTPLKTIYGDQLELQLYDVSIPSSYRVFAALHERYPNLPGGVPQIYVDRYVLVGSIEIRDELPRLIEDCLGRGGCDWPFSIVESARPEPTPSPAAQQDNPVYVAYCYDPACIECDQITIDLNYLQSQYPNLIVRQFNIWDDAAAIEAMCERYGVPSEERLRVPAVFVGEQYLGVDEISLPRLTNLVEDANVTVHSPPWEGLPDTAGEASDSIIERFQSFSVVAVAAAGLLDGINPCAFTTIIFFISYLALVGRGKRDILYVGGAFTLAVFVTYLAMGLGLSAIIERIGSTVIIARVIYGGTALVCLVLAGLSLLDFLKIRQGRASDISLQLPSVLKKRIHQTIRTHSRMRGFVAASFGAGVLVSVFELACTGQVYLPTIVYMTSIPEMRMSAIGYLILYNALFVVPLIIVFSVTYFGINSQQLTSVFKANVGTVKLLTAGLFGLLGLWLAILLFT